MANRQDPVSIAAIVLAVAAIVGASVWSAVREQRRLLDEFAVATQRQAHASAELLSARLDALDQDTRLLILIVRDPAGTAWAGCETPPGCRAAAASEVADLAPTPAIRISERPLDRSSFLAGFGQNGGEVDVTF
jgi:type II secretory pathway pseudopilin PulG